MARDKVENSSEVKRINRGNTFGETRAWVLQTKKCKKACFHPAVKKSAFLMGQGCINASGTDSLHIWKGITSASNTERYSWVLE